MKRLLITFVALTATLAFAATGAQATTLTFSMNVPGFSLSGNASSKTASSPWTVVDQVANPCCLTLGNLTDISGSKNYDISGATYAVTGTKSHNLGQDNKLYFGSGTIAFDSNGLLLMITQKGTDKGLLVLITHSSGQFSIKLYNSTGTTELAWENVKDATMLKGPSSFVQMTPEPSSLLLTGTGLFALALLFFWKSKNTRKSPAAGAKAA